MDQDQETCAFQVVEFCRDMNCKAAAKYAEVGIRMEDIAIGAMYSALDLAIAHKGDPVLAMEWARTALDVAERGILSGETVQ